MPLHKYIKSNAATLIEMMLVVTVIAVTAVGGITVVQRQNEENRINRTAEQIQNIITASKNYYDKYRDWPSLSTLNSYASSNFSSLNGTNPWGQANSVHTSSNSRYVKTTVPDNKAARALFQKLPLSWYDTTCTSNCEVKFAYNKPVKQAWYEALVKLPIIKDITTLSLGSTASGQRVADGTVINVTPPSCSQHYYARTAVGLLKFGRVETGNPKQWIGQFAVCTKNSHNEVCKDNKPSSDHQAKIHMWGTINSQDAHADLIVVKYCEPK